MDPMQASAPARALAVPTARHTASLRSLAHIKAFRRNQLAAPTTHHTALLRSLTHTRSIQMRPAGSTGHRAHCIASKLGPHLHNSRDATRAARCTAALPRQACRNGSHVGSLPIQGSAVEVNLLPALWCRGQPVEVWATSLAAVLQQCPPGSK